MVVAHLYKIFPIFSFFEFLDNFLSSSFRNFKIILKKFLVLKIIDSYIYFKKNYYILKDSRYVKTSLEVLTYLESSFILRYAIEKPIQDT